MSHKWLFRLVYVCRHSFFKYFVLKKTIISQRPIRNVEQTLCVVVNLTLLVLILYIFQMKYFMDLNSAIHKKKNVCEPLGSVQTRYPVNLSSKWPPAVQNCKITGLGKCKGKKERAAKFVHLIDLCYDEHAEHFWWLFDLRVRAKTVVLTFF